MKVKVSAPSVHDTHAASTSVCTIAIFVKLTRLVQSGYPGTMPRVEEDKWWRYRASKAELELADVKAEIVKVQANAPPPLDEIEGNEKYEVCSWWFNMSSVRERAPAASTLSRLWADREKMRAERKWGDLAHQTCMLACTWKKAWDQIYEWELERKKNIAMQRHTAHTKVMRLEKRQRTLENVVAKEKEAEEKRRKVQAQATKWWQDKVKAKKEQQEKEEKKEQPEKKEEKTERQKIQAACDSLRAADEEALAAELQRYLDEPDEDMPDEDFRPHPEASSSSRQPNPVPCPSTSIPLPNGPLV